MRSELKCILVTRPRERYHGLHGTMTVLIILLQVYEALSSKNWGASSTLMNEIASESND